MAFRGSIGIRRQQKDSEVGNGILRSRYGIGIGRGIGIKLQEKDSEAGNGIRRQDRDSEAGKELGC